jgi:hypothetical protein
MKRILITFICLIGYLTPYIHAYDNFILNHLLYNSELQYFEFYRDLNILN